MFIGIYGVSVLFSYLGMVLNFVSIYLMLTGNIKLSILCFMGSAFIDMIGLILGQALLFFFFWVVLMI